MQVTMGAHLDIERYLRGSRRIEPDRFDWSVMREVPLTEAEGFCLGYMMDIESQTPFYLRDLMTPRAMREPALVAFLPLWAYEEGYHAESLRRLLAAAGRPVDPGRAVALHERAQRQELVERVGARLLGAATRHFVAAHMAWGAINELTTLVGYQLLARRTANPVVRQLLSEIAKDERRHYSFYLSQARRRLEGEPVGQRFVSFLLRRFWTPVGQGVKTRAEVDDLGRYLFYGAEGRAAARTIDEGIHRIPGLAWFDGMTRNVLAAQRAVGST